MDEAEYRQRIRTWAAAERIAVVAEEMLLSTMREHLARGGPPPSDEMQRSARERRAEAEALFKALDVKDGPAKPNPPVSPTP